MIQRKIVIITTACTCTAAGVAKAIELGMHIIGGASAASEANLSSCPLRFVVYVGIIVRATNP